ncbi:hypothetical protein SELMODRAFT_419678 [Selaginella moellendorffii]|uniref:Uncharacterized protein n=1 Tax=Selaginella moellendorffii TaxID=88036 RepID=D8S9P5_SELML|nr:hypothetical protein SELMODRAFT_419678 [Selaginella moellendorffii]
MMLRRTTITERGSMFFGCLPALFTRKKKNTTEIEDSETLVIVNNKLCPGLKSLLSDVTLHDQPSKKEEAEVTLPGSGRDPRHHDQPSTRHDQPSKKEGAATMMAGEVQYDHDCPSNKDEVVREIVVPIQQQNLLVAGEVEKNMTKRSCFRQSCPVSVGAKKKKVRFAENTKEGYNMLLDPLPLELQVRLAQLEVDLEMDLLSDLYMLYEAVFEKNWRGTAMSSKKQAAEVCNEKKRAPHELGAQISAELLERRRNLLSWKKLLLHSLDPENFPDNNSGVSPRRFRLRRCSDDPELEIGVTKLELWLELRALYHITRYRDEFKIQKSQGDQTLDSTHSVVRILNASYFNHKSNYEKKLASCKNQPKKHTSYNR